MKIMKIVYVDIVGDLFHYGHIRFLKQAKEHGDILIVGLMSDEECIQYKRKPFLNINERRETIEACKYVDKVIVNAPMPITEEFIDKYNIDYVCHGDDMNKESLEYWYSVPIKLNKFILTKYTKSISTTDIINRIKNR